MFSIYFDFSPAIAPFHLIVPALDTSGRHHLKGKRRGGCNCHYSDPLLSVPAMEEKNFYFIIKKVAEVQLISLRSKDSLSFQRLELHSFPWTP